MHRLAPACLLALLAGPAVAQDLSAQFTDAARSFLLPGTQSLSGDDLASDGPIIALLPSLAGDWVDLTPLFPAMAMDSPDLLARSCELNASTLVPSTARSFEMRRAIKDSDPPATLAVRYDWTIGSHFQRSVDEADLIASLGMTETDRIFPGLLIAPALRGFAQLFHPSPDILVIASPYRPPEFWGRCPA